ncbi:hypothetical protein K1719_009350 [Acacia pycnantha]|nr:hypothetical protein K1719_009350 [Acacia pycnantha]
MHSYTLKSGLVTHATVGCSLFTVYSKCGCLEESHRVFEEVPDKDNVSWASMIAGFVEQGYAGHAFQLFKEMMSQEISPDYLTLTAILTACYALSFLQAKHVAQYLPLPEDVLREDNQVELDDASDTVSSSAV